MLVRPPQLQHVPAASLRLNFVQAAVHAPTVVLPEDTDDLWTWRGARPPADPHPIGHEFVGVVEEIGAGVSTLSVGDFVIGPFSISDSRIDSNRNCRIRLTGLTPSTFRTPTSFARSRLRAVDRFIKLIQAISMMKIPMQENR